MASNGNGLDARGGITGKEIELYAGAGDLNAKITAGTTDVKQTVTEPIITTTITYLLRSNPVNILPGFRVRYDFVGFLDRQYTLTVIPLRD